MLCLLFGERARTFDSLEWRGAWRNRYGSTRYYPRNILSYMALIETVRQET